jgi:Mor family transcriptional regulator
MTMADQLENEKPQTEETVNSKELRQAFLSELEASKQAITELSDEELEEVAGGSPWQKIGGFMRNGGGRQIWTVAGEGLGKAANGLAIYGAYSAGKQQPAGTPPQTPHR